jgi:glyoxylase-like metal-dependent hydrolase (beta-lactamase superfamily II)
MRVSSLPQGFEPHYGYAVPVGRGVRRLTAPNAGPLTFAGTNSYIVGTGKVAVIDPGPDDESHLRALMAAAAGETITHILVTHAHRDHSAGAARLAAAANACVYGRGRQGSRGRAADAGVDVGFVPDVVLTDGTIVTGEGWRLEAVATPGHARDHLVFALIGSDFLFSGDHVMGWSTTVVAPPEGSMTDYMASLDRLLARSEDTYLPGHGGPIANAHDRVRALKAHRLERAAAILAALTAGATTIPAIVAAVYADVDPALSGAAGLSVHAHLLAMIAEGKVASDGEPTMDASYRLIHR